MVSNLSLGVGAFGSKILASFSSGVEKEKDIMAPPFNLGFKSSGKIAFSLIFFKISISLKTRVDLVKILTGNLNLAIIWSNVLVSFNSFSISGYGSVDDATAINPYSLFFALLLSCFTKISGAFAFTESLWVVSPP